MPGQVPSRSRPMIDARPSAPWRDDRGPKQVRWLEKSCTRWRRAVPWAAPTWRVAGTTLDVYDLAWHTAHSGAPRRGAQRDMQIGVATLAAGRTVYAVALATAAPRCSATHRGRAEAQIEPRCRLPYRRGRQGEFRFVPFAKGAPRPGGPPGAAACPRAADSCETQATALLAWFAENGADLPWRRTRGPVRILSRGMLQQTQVARVLERSPRGSGAVPNASSWRPRRRPTWLRAWSGLGYNRRALTSRTREARPSSRRVPARDRDLEQLPESVVHRARDRVASPSAEVTALDTMSAGLERSLGTSDVQPPPAGLGLEPGALDSRTVCLGRVAALRSPPARRPLPSARADVRAAARQSRFEGSRGNRRQRYRARARRGPRAEGGYIETWSFPARRRPRRAGARTASRPSRGGYAP